MIQVPPEFKRWVSGLKGLQPTAAEVTLWEQVRDVMFERTQRYVHVWHYKGGDLKRSGRVEPGQVMGPLVTAEVKYGGVPGRYHGVVDYAGYELARGGSHDFFQLAQNDVEAMFSAAVGEMAKAMIERSVR